MAISIAAPKLLAMSAGARYCVGAFVGIAATVFGFAMGVIIAILLGVMLAIYGVDGYYLP